MAGGAVTVAAVGVAAAGAATTVIGGSEVAEGGQDVVFGALGSDTSSVNVVRDFGYGGDEAAYNQAKGIVTTTAAVGTMVLAPVAQTVSAASGGMKSGKADSTKQTKTTSNTGATSGKTATSGNSGKSTTSALKLKSGKTDAVGQTKTAGNAGTRKFIKSNSTSTTKPKTGNTGKVTNKSISQGQNGSPKFRPQKPRQPDRNTWVQKGGTVNDNRDGTTTYTNKNGQSVTYNKDGYPNFKKYELDKVEIDMKGKKADFSAADKAYREKIGDPDWKKPADMTWHHNEDGKTMQLIPREINREFSHTGGASIVRNKPK
ncbi:MAG: hypothetical protein GXY86_08095 [Firmicutes bacterium]|nr:hypothetical protein [Bacillota bacterium]